MKNALLMTLFFFFLSYASEIPFDQSLSQPSNSLESIVVELLTQIKTITNVLEGVEDEESDNAALELIQLHIVRLKTVR